MARIQITSSIAIDDTELTEKFVRAGGPGGQNVNKVSTAVQLRFSVKNAATLPERVRMKILNSGDQRLTKECELVLIADSHRTQEANRRDALERLKKIIREAAFVKKRRIPTRPGAGVKRRRAETKTKRSTIKKARSRRIELD